MRLVSYARLNPGERRISLFQLVLGILAALCFLVICADLAGRYVDQSRGTPLRSTSLSKRKSRRSTSKSSLLKVIDKTTAKQKPASINAKPLSPPSSIDRLRHISQLCGRLCDDEASTTAAVLGTQGKFRVVPISRPTCAALHSYPYIHARRRGKALRRIPPRILSNFTMHQRVKLRYRFSERSGSQPHARRWSADLIAQYLDQIENEEFAGPYGEKASSELLALLERVGMQKKRVLVLDGGGAPWVEALSLFAGADQVAVVGRDAIASEDARVRTYTHRRFGRAFLGGRVRPFDVVIAYGALQAAGLGGAGDALSPWDDVLLLAKAWCAARKDARLVLKLPRSKQDWLIFNSYRIYGPKRLRILTTNWRQTVPDNDDTWDWQLPVYGWNSRAMLFAKV